jgi:hypothetical protein
MVRATTLAIALLCAIAGTDARARCLDPDDSTPAGLRLLDVGEPCKRSNAQLSERQKIERHAAAAKARDAIWATQVEYLSLRPGMPYLSVESIIGFAGIEQSRTDIYGVSSVYYIWSNPDTSYLIVNFQNDKLVSKSQNGLP